MASDLTPYGQGREWARFKGPHRRLTCEEAMEAHGYDLDSPEAEREAAVPTLFGLLGLDDAA
ncbi:hypothetical protein D6851_02420 [Altericroceibacterium spongiae]|uniref:Uncharacterized protein n=2 Tax=Altericroceibacterium spongiae TaxID=2320269 RepID=A0A420ERL8_9SPHN|nr:hypothetical protein D6851_02420 [Altericroceibacterium spongiae]